MAEGSSSLKYVQQVTDTALALKPRSVVDLGMGTGKYGFLLREQHDLAKVHWGEEPWRLRLVGVEMYDPYVTDVQKAVYDEIIVNDALRYLQETSDTYDVALALDILEHFTPEDGEEFLRAALQRATNVIVLTPRHYYEQIGHENTAERHLSWWPRRALSAVAERAGAKVTVAQDRAANLAVFSLAGEPAVAGREQRWREAAISVRDRLIPETAWMRWRGDSGPTV